MRKAQSFEYKHDGLVCEGYATWDDAGGKRPGILVFPEWVGVGEYTHKRAEMLCELGYNSVVVDGRFGLFAQDGTTSFDNLSLKSNDSLFQQLGL